MINFFKCGRYQFPMQGANFKPLVMGILNVTPDSFSDGGQHFSLNNAISRAEQMLADGVDIIDVGGESSRPGAMPLPLNQELDRVMPVIYALRDCGVPLSVDTYKTEVMRESILAGVDMINDINGFRAAGAISTVATSDVGLCVMHMQNTPQTMQVEPVYDEVSKSVADFFTLQIEALSNAGIDRNRVCIDPGFGFGKSQEHNIALFKSIQCYQDKFGMPMLIGISRKSLIGALTGRLVERRLAGSLAAALVAINHGAKIIRVHDVAETVDAMKVWRALSN